MQLGVGSKPSFFSWQSELGGGDQNGWPSLQASYHGYSAIYSLSISAFTLHFDFGGMGSCLFWGIHPQSIVKNILFWFVKKLKKRKKKKGELCNHSMFRCWLHLFYLRNNFIMCFGRYQQVSYTVKVKSF